MVVVDINSRKKAYKNAILHQQTTKISKLKQELGKELSPEAMKVFLQETNKWKNQSFELGKKTVALAKTGKGRDSLEFDDLQKKSKGAWWKCQGIYMPVI